MDDFGWTFDLMLNQIGIDDLSISNLEGSDNNAISDYNHINKILSSHFYFFDATEVKQW